MDGKYFTRKASSKSESNAAVRRPSGADRRSNDFAQSPRPGTGNGRPTGNGETEPSFVPTMCFNRRPNDLQNKPKVAMPKMSGRAKRTNATANKVYNKNPFEEISVVMDKMTPLTLFSSAKVLLNILVDANAARPKEFGRLVEYLVQKAIDEQKKSSLYAHLCSEAYRKSWVDPRDEVRAAFGDLFKRELVAACNKFQSAAGVPNQTTRPKYRRVDHGEIERETRKRTLGASRFLGELYTANTFKLLDAVTANINTLMRARDENSLECLTVLMAVIDSKFDKVEESATEWTTKKIYAELRKIASRSHADKTLSPCTIAMINKLLCLPGISDDGTRKNSDDNSTIRVRTSVVPENVAGDDDRTRPDITSNEQLMHSIAAVVENLTADTVSESSRVFLDILVKASEDKRLNFGLAMNYIVQKAIDNSANSLLYACLCSEANKNASKDTRDSVRNRFPDIFKIGLMKSCNKVLWEAGIQSQASTRRPAKRTQIPKEVDATTRGRSLQTCRFMGHLFLVNAFKIYNIVSSTIGALLKARNEHSMECLCAMLMIIGPRFELVEDYAVLRSAKRVYEDLKRLMISGYEENILSLNTVKTINQVLRLREQNWTSVSQELRHRHHGQFVQNVELEMRNIERPANTEGPVRKGGGDQ